MRSDDIAGFGPVGTNGASARPEQWLVIDRDRIVERFCSRADAERDAERRARLDAASDIDSCITVAKTMCTATASKQVVCEIVDAP